MTGSILHDQGADHQADDGGERNGIQIDGCTETEIGDRKIEQSAECTEHQLRGQGQISSEKDDSAGGLDLLAGYASDTSD